MKAQILERAHRLGFDLCRFTSAAAPDHSAEFAAWIAEGRHGQMEYLARNAAKRMDPQKVLPGSRSIIVLATSYHLERGEPAKSNRTPSPALGQIARYACFEDYHDVIAEKLKTLMHWVDQAGGSGARSLWYVDTGPLIERDLAQRAGVGFIGKHANLISRELGNWFFLSEIITTIEIEPDPPEKNRCGSCSRCIGVCPTGAIIAPFQLDARRCISYLTIELKGPIPVEFRRVIDNRIYGCDDCLAVCPWNRFAREGNLMRLHLQADLDVADLLELLSLDEAEFKKRFAGTPILRAKRCGLLRNVCLALGNIGDAQTLPQLQRAASDPEPLIAEHAQWAIQEIERRQRS